MRTRTISFLLIFFSLIMFPYAYGLQAGGGDFVFGGFLLNPMDGNSYLAKMYQGWRGEWRFTLPYTADAGTGAYLFLFYLFLGHIARLTGLSLLVVFHLARLLSALALVLVLWRFLDSTCCRESRNHQSKASGNDATSSEPYSKPSASATELVFYLATLGLGLGWLIFPFGVVVSDLWVAETYPFLSAYINPHFTLGMALLLWLLTLPSTDKRSGPLKLGIDWILLAWPAGLVSLLLSVISPFGVMLALVVLGGIGAWEVAEHFILERWKSVRLHLTQADYQVDPSSFGWLSFIIIRWAWIFFFGTPLLLYDFMVVRTDSVLAGWNSQNLTPSPPIWDLILSLSPALLLALVGAWAVLHNPTKPSRLVLVWAVVGSLMVYLPFDLQRRFMIALFVPLAVLAGYGLDWLSVRKPRRVRTLGMLLLYFSLPSTLLVLFIGYYGIRTRDSMLYMTRGETQAFDWIQRYTPADSLILAAPETGMFIPAHTGRRVIYGHPFETVNAEEEKQVVTEFFQGVGVNHSYWMDFLSHRGVNYVFFGPRERRLGFLPRLDSLELVYFSDGIEIYQLR